ncbi:hypothetical protein PFISCL1PPCAC_9621, partial [Pristionchus fissidentatus]
DFFLEGWMSERQRVQMENNRRMVDVEGVMASILDCVVQEIDGVVCKMEECDDDDVMIISTKPGKKDKAPVPCKKEVVDDDDDIMIVEKPRKQKVAAVKQEMDDDDVVVLTGNFPSRRQRNVRRVQHAVIGRWYEGDIVKVEEQDAAGNPLNTRPHRPILVTKEETSDHELDLYTRDHTPPPRANRTFHNGEIAPLFALPIRRDDSAAAAAATAAASPPGARFDAAQQRDREARERGRAMKRSPSRSRSRTPLRDKRNSRGRGRAPLRDQRQPSIPPLFTVPAMHPGLPSSDHPQDPGHDIGRRGESVVGGRSPSRSRSRSPLRARRRSYGRGRAIPRRIERQASIPPLFSLPQRTDQQGAAGVASNASVAPTASGANQAESAVKKDPSDEDLFVTKFVKGRAPPSYPPINSHSDSLQAHVHKRPGTEHDPVFFDKKMPETTIRGQSCTITVRSDEEKCHFDVVMLDPTYGSYPLEAVRVTRDEHALHSLKAYEFEFTPRMFGPHMIVLTTREYFLVHSLRVVGDRPQPQRRHGAVPGRRPLPRLEVTGVSRDLQRLFHAPRQRRDDEKFIDVRQVLERLLG